MLENDTGLFDDAVWTSDDEIDFCLNIWILVNCFGYVVSASASGVKVLYADRPIQLVHRSKLAPAREWVYLHT